MNELNCHPEISEIQPKKPEVHSGLFDNYNSLNNSGKWLHVCEKKHLVYQGFLDEQKNITIGTEIKKNIVKITGVVVFFSPLFSNEQSAILHANRCISKGILGGLILCLI